MIMTQPAPETPPANRPFVKPALVVILTPGAYLKHRRQAQLLSLRDVAERIRTDPPIPEHDRIAWLEQIECDIAPISIATIEALRHVYRFDRSVLAALGAIARGERDPQHAPKLCRICACSWRDACTDHAEACAWVAGEDLCTSCVATPIAGPAATPTVPA